ncbi:MAG: chemotaxis protein CheW [Polyangiaceae bacterium]
MVTLAKARSGRRAARRAGEGGSRTEVLAFALGHGTYAVGIEQLAEICRPPPMTEIPRGPRNVIGVVTVRGRLVTVIDLRRVMHVEPMPISRKSCILLVSSGTEDVGFLVDDVQEVWRLAQEEIEPAGALGGDQPAHIVGIARPQGAGGATLVLLDLRPLVGSSW